MAAMLFGGTGPTSAAPTTTPASRPSRISTSSSAAAGTRSAVATPSSSTSSPQRKASASSPAAAAAAAAPAPAAADPVDLLDFMGMEDSAPAPAVGAAASNGAAQGHASVSSDQLGMDLLGVGGSGNSSAPTSSPSAAQNLDDLLGGGGGLSSNGAAALGAGVPNGRRNSSGSAGGAGEQAWPPAARQRAGTAGSASSASGSAGAPSLIGGGASRTGDLDLSGLLLGGGAGGGAGTASVGFSFGGRAVRPLAIATGEFGKRWMACPGERRAAGTRLSPGLGSPKAVAERLGSRLGVHTVEIIPHTAEGICAGQLDGGGVCLVHCKVGEGRVRVACMCWVSLDLTRRRLVARGVDGRLAVAVFLSFFSV